MLSMQHISKVYRTDLVETHALRDFSLDVGDGEFVAVTGPSGSGKTTFLNIAHIKTKITQCVRFAGEPPAGLRQNQRVSVRIVLEASDDVLMVQRGPFLDTGGGRVAYVVNDGLAERRAIQIGASSINSLEIASGLEEGEQIVISSIGQFNGVNTVYISD